MRLEHVNFTVNDPIATAETPCKLFGWRIRWQGEAISGGTSVHVGDDVSYLALYIPPTALNAAPDNYTTIGGLNHIGIVVDDLEAVEARVKAEGFVPHNHADYEPGRRFYFDGPDRIEYEVVSYS